jgi:hypothetical protein
MIDFDDILKMFVDDKKENKAGRGKKQCDECKNYVPVRLRVCDCGHEFVAKEIKSEQESEITEEIREYARVIGSPGGRIVYVGSQKPSVDLKEVDYDSVRDYCNLIIHEGIQNKIIYTIGAIKNFIQHQFEYNSKEYNIISRHVDQWYKEKQSVIV